MVRASIFSSSLFITSFLKMLYWKSVLTLPLQLILVKSQCMNSLILSSPSYYTILFDKFMFLGRNMAWRSHYFLIDPDDDWWWVFTLLFLGLFFFHVFFLSCLFSFASFFIHFFFICCIFLFLHLFVDFRNDFWTDFWKDFRSLLTLVLPLLTVSFH